MKEGEGMGKEAEKHEIKKKHTKIKFLLPYAVSVSDNLGPIS
jgi:hypothetical protein